MATLHIAGTQIYLDDARAATIPEEFKSLRPGGYMSIEETDADGTRTRYIRVPFEAALVIDF